ncbi:MAG: gcrA cell cycle regulator family protein [Alphaproteobacteria bacterium]|nr:gcrA cell cycle regulator family protein [Alphaproteobacteria bacterium]
MSWTDDRVALLKKLWGEGKTAAEIAKELGGVTRNAVIGKAHRLKLSNRVSPIQQNKKPAVKAPVTTKPVLEKKAAPAVVVRAASNESRRPKVPLIDLKANECRWADGDPREEDFGFCGARALPGLPYCTEHAKIAYQAATRNRILKNQGAQDEVTAEELEAAKKAVNQ